MDKCIITIAIIGLLSFCSIFISATIHILLKPISDYTFTIIETIFTTIMWFCLIVGEILDSKLEKKLNKE